MLPLLALTLAVPSSYPSAPPKAPAKKSAVSSRKKPSAKKRTAGSRSRTRRKGSARARTPSQQQPEPQRIREIQQALSQRGYAVEPNGVWDAATVEALKKFQEDHDIHNLSGRGKLDPLTLIALGLGPAHARPALSGAGAPQNSTEGKQP